MRCARPTARDRLLVATDKAGWIEQLDAQFAAHAVQPLGSGRDAPARSPAACLATPSQRSSMLKAATACSRLCA
jgi:hypothetical protein